MHSRMLLKPAALGLLAAICSAGAGLAQQQSLDGVYRGTLVCEHLSGAVGILRAPLDITVTNGTVIAARPVFNFDGSRVVGSEIAIGAVGDGALHLTSTWLAIGAGFKGTYTGTLTMTGGTITGTQAWTRPPVKGGDASRACYGAFVKIRKPE